MIRRTVLAVTMAATALALVPASAEHCGNPVNFLTGSQLLLLNPRAAGCDVVAEDIPETSGEDSNTDYIIPGSTQGIVRWLEASEPVDGVKAPDAPVTGSRIEFNGTTTALKFTAGTGLDGTPGDFWDSQAVTIGREPSLTGGDAVITVCRDEASTDCETVTYRTVGSA